VCTFVRELMINVIIFSYTLVSGRLPSETERIAALQNQL
jgi:hypothetical protein